MKQVAACLEDAGHVDIAKKLLTEEKVSDSEWRTLREFLCPPDLKVLFAERRKTKRTAVCERAGAKYKWNQQTKRRHAMAYHMEALGKSFRIPDKLRSDQYVKLTPWEMEEAVKASKTFRTTLEQLAIDGFPGLATRLQARQFADLTDKEKDRFHRYAAMTYEQWAFDNENLHGGDRALRVAEERFFYHHLDHADDCRCPACRTKRWIAEEQHNKGRGSTHTSKRRQSACVNASDDDDIEWEQGSS